MNKRKVINVIIFVLILTMSLSFIYFKTYAANGFDKAGITGDKNAFVSDVTPKSVSNLVNESVISVITIMRIAGITIAVVMLLVVAMKYMISSAGDRADIKKHAVVYVVGALVLFGVTGILGMLSNIAGKAFVQN